MAAATNRNFDTNAIILDYMPEGRSIGKTSDPIAHVLGETQFAFYELLVRPHASLKQKEFISLSKDHADSQILRSRLITMEALTDSAVDAIEECVSIIIDNNEQRFIDFFNNAHPITTRLHQLELLPGVGKKYLWDIIKQRKMRPYSSFQDLTERVKISDPKKSILRRIMLELKREEKYYLFVPRPRPQSREIPEANRRYDDNRRREPGGIRRNY